jgi:hypothetical protein
MPMTYEKESDFIYLYFISNRQAKRLSSRIYI